MQVFSGFFPPSISINLRYFVSKPQQKDVNDL